MATNADVAALGRLLAAPARAAMLDALFDGDAWSVGDLARAARVSTSTASEHLDQLRKGGLVAASQNGRYRLYRLAGPEVAHALECLGALAPPLAARGLAEDSRNEALRLGRTCYDHLAGIAGVELLDALLVRGFVLPSQGPEPLEYRLTTVGETMLFARGVRIDEARRSRRNFACACQDWTEGRPHLAGALGMEILQALIRDGVVIRGDGTRVVEVTSSICDWLDETFKASIQAWSDGASDDHSVHETMEELS